MGTEISEKFIDIEKVIASKNSKLLQRLPKFIICLIKNLLHVDQINASIYKHRDKFGSAFAEAILHDFGIAVEVLGLENLPAEGNTLVVANHPLGGVDGMALISTIGSVKKEILFPVNDLLLHLPGLRPIFIPINKHGGNRSHKESIEKAFASDKTLLYFPAGLCSRKQKGVICDLEWKSTFVKKAVQYKKDIVPVLIDAQNTKRFYTLANLRKKLGLRTNIEFFLLPDEMYRQKGKKIRILIGKPISYQLLNSTHSAPEWASLIRDHVYKLKENPQMNFVPS